MARVMTGTAVQGTNLYGQPMTATKRPDRDPMALVLERRERLRGRGPWGGEDERGSKPVAINPLAPFPTTTAPAVTTSKPTPKAKQNPKTKPALRTPIAAIDPYFRSQHGTETCTREDVDYIILEIVTDRKTIQALAAQMSLSEMFIFEVLAANRLPSRLRKIAAWIESRKSGVEA